MLTILRNSANEHTTKGEIFFDGEWIAYTLEDIVRMHGQKVMHKTALPAGIYKGVVSMSPKYDRLMVMIYTEKDQMTIEKNGMTFTGSRIHGGNDKDDTSGCVLAAYNDIDENKIQGTAEAKLTALCKQKYGNKPFLIQIVNNF